MDKETFLKFFYAYKSAKSTVQNMSELLGVENTDLEEDIDEMFDAFIMSHFNDEQQTKIFDFIYGEYSDIDTEEELWDSIMESLT